LVGSANRSICLATEIVPLLSEPHGAPAASERDVQVERIGDDDDPTLSVADAARLLGRDRTRVYALLRSGDLVAAPGDGEDGQSGPVRVVRASAERWLVAGGGQGGPLAPRNAWALIGLASGDQAFSERCIGLLERPEEVSRTRARLARESLVDLAPRLRRRATLLVRGVPSALREALERDAALVRSGLSAAHAYGWAELLRPGADSAWVLDAYLPLEAFSALQEELNRRDVDDTDDAPGRDQVLLGVVDEPWPFPPHYQLAAQPLAALDLLDYPDTTARRIGRGVLETLKETPAPLLARRTARARAKNGPLLGRLLGGLHQRRGPRPVVEGDPRTDTRGGGARGRRAVGRRLSGRDLKRAARGDRPVEGATRIRVRVPARSGWRSSATARSSPS
jgi:hypothetical protein